MMSDEAPSSMIVKGGGDSLLVVIGCIMGVRDGRICVGWVLIVIDVGRCILALCWGRWCGVVLRE